MSAIPSRSILSAIALLACSALTRAQTCSDPATLCPEEPLNLSFALDSDQLLDFDCIDATHVAVLQFQSNHDFQNPGTARIRISQVSCPGAAGPDSLSAVVVSAAGAPCDAANLTAVGPCVTGVDDLLWETPILDHNSTHYLLIGTRHNPSDTACSMFVELEGNGVTLNACCNHALLPGESAELSVEGGDPVFGYQWSPEFYLSDPNQGTTTVTPDDGIETLTYQVDGQIGDCQVSSSVTVTVGPPFSPPNSFTPNGDNINDLWRINGIAAFPNAKVEVFNRWGQLVHRSLGYSQPWDGTGRSGKALDPGTYYFSIELNDQDLPIAPVTGFVSIIR